METEQSDLWLTVGLMRELMRCILAQADVHQGITLEADEVALLAPLIRRMAPEGYVTAVGELFATGVGDANWNGRFREELSKRGLALADAPRRSFAYPDGGSYFAPAAYGPNEGWPSDTFIVWAEDLNPPT